MTPFHDGYLPLPESAWVMGGPERRTEVVERANGREERNAVWRHGRRRYDVGVAFASPDARALLLAFFEARRGRLQGFRFRDPLDCKSCAPTQTPGAGDMPIGVGDGATRIFQLTRTYGDGVAPYVRPITKPVDATVSIAINGSAVAPSEFGVDPLSGLVTLAVAPTAGHLVTAGFVFDTPVRFAEDRIELPCDGREASVQLMEIL